MDRAAFRRPCHPLAKYGYSPAPPRSSLRGSFDATRIAAAADFQAEAPAPRFLLVRVKAGPPAAYKRGLDPAACRRRFRNAYLRAGWRAGHAYPFSTGTMVTPPAYCSVGVSSMVLTFTRQGTSRA